MEKLTVSKETHQLHIPERHQLGNGKRKLHIKTPWVNQMETLDKDEWQSTIKEWHRRPPQKPYVPEGFIEINGERFEVEFV